MTVAEANDVEVKKMRYVSSTTIFLVLLIPILTAATVTSVSAPGDLDLTFSGDGKLTDWEGYATGVVIQPDGKIVVAFGPDFSVARYNTDGSRDTTFGGAGIVQEANFGPVTAIAIQSDGKIVAANSKSYYDFSDGVCYDSFVLTRYNPNGSRDTSFDNDGYVSTQVGIGEPGTCNSQLNSAAIQPDGKIVVAGSIADAFGVVRYNPDGSPDTTFGGGGPVTTSICADCHDQANSVAIQADGKIVAVGGGFDKTNYPKFEVVRYNTDGSLDTTFDSDGRLTTDFWKGQYATAVGIQGDGKVVAGGVVSGPFAPHFALARYNSNGSLDTTFDSDGKVTTPMGLGGGVSSIAIQSDGKIIALGDTATGFDGNNSDFAIARYTSNGSLDSTYGGGGIATVDFDNPNDAPLAMALDSAGRAVVVGESFPNIAIARLLPNLAEEVSISGRVTTSNGRGLGNATVLFTDSLGVRRTARTSTFGYYSFNNIPGDTYDIAISSKRYQFEPQTVLVNENLSGLDFVALE